MIDKKGFIDLFGINIPTIDHFDYYIGQLSKSRKYSNIKRYVTLWERDEIEFGDLSRIKNEKIDEIVDFISNSGPMMEINFDKNIPDYPSSRSLKYSEEFKYISISLVESNWVSLKKYDPTHINELGESWSLFLDKFYLPNVFKESIHFRNSIFTKLDSKKISKIQRGIIQEIVRDYQNDFQLEGVRNDEVIFKFEDFKDIQLFSKLDPKYLIKLFTISRFDGYRVDTIYDVNGRFIGRELVNLDSNLFFLKLKEHITGENLDIRDLYFSVNGKLAAWVDPRSQIVLK